MQQFFQLANIPVSTQCPKLPQVAPDEREEMCFFVLAGLLPPSWSLWIRLVSRGGSEKLLLQRFGVESREAALSPSLTLYTGC